MAGSFVPISLETLQEILPAYEIIGLLGQGGMGAVFKARQKSLKRLVAIKVLPAGRTDDEFKFVERFRSEAETLAQMNHPAIVGVYDFGETPDGLLYFVMEYVDGTDVQQMIHAGGRLAGDHARAITAHVCDALHYAHQRGVIHRDIKPANILIDREGHVKVADFGLAKVHDPSGPRGLTRPDMAMGTPDYVAPEILVKGTVADHRADLYAVGVMLYQMLTGDVPRGMFKLPSEKDAAIDPRFDAIICKAMEADRDERYQSALEVRHALDEIATTPLARNSGLGAVPVSSLPPRTREASQTAPAASRRAKWLATAAIVAVLGVAGFILESGKRKQPVNSSSASNVAPAAKPGQTIDLLALVDVSRDAIAGRWSMTDRGLSVANPGGAAVLQLPYLPPEEYDFEVEFTADDIGLNVNQYVSAEGHSFAWKLNAHNRTPPLYGFELLDGKFTKDDIETAATTDVAIEAGHRHRSTVEVRRGRLRGLLDGREIVNWSGDMKRLTIESHSRLRDERHIGIGSWKRAVTFHKITVRDASGGKRAKEASQPIGPGAPPAPPVEVATWRDVTAEVREMARAAPAFAVDAQAIRRASMGPDVTLPLNPSGERGQAIRVRYSGEVQVDLHRNPGGFLYLLVQTKQTMFHSQASDPTQPPVIFMRNVLHPPDYDFGQPHDLVFTFVGMRLRVWIDDRFVGESTADTFTEGATELLFKPMTVVYKVEYGELQ